MAKAAICPFKPLLPVNGLSVNHWLLLRNICVAMCMFGAAACKNGKLKTKIDDSLQTVKHLNVADSLQMAHNIDSADYNTLFKNKTNIWLFKMLLNKQNKWENFHLIDYWRKDSLTQYDYKPDTAFYREYAMFLEWSPDSSYILDHGSYGVTMAEDNKGRYYVAGSEADQEISLINCKTKKTARLLFFGPGTGALGAHWIDAEQVAMLGLYTPDNNSRTDTLLWIINIRDKLFRKYKYRHQHL